VSSKTSSVSEFCSKLFPLLDPKGANNQIKDKFDSVIRSNQQPDQLEGIPLREDFDEDDDASIEDVPIDNNDNNNSSGTLEESEISMNNESSH
jgi:hypothetical protein